MKIKNRLSIYFTAISTVVLLIVEIAICITFNSLIKSEFYGRLMDRATVAAQVYLEADEISADSLSHVRERYLQRLPGEVVRFYDDKDAASFIKDKNQFWTSTVINQVRQKKSLQFVEGPRQTVGIYYYDNQGDFVILVSAIDQAGDKRLFDLIKSMAVLLVSVMAGLFIISQWFAKKTLEPIDQLITQMRRVSAGNLSLRVNEGNGKDEISALAYNFNRLLEHLENAFELQQTFVINASHELRTPITSIIGEIEISINKVRTATEYEQVLLSVLNDAERLKNTISSLLELAHVDMNYTQPAFKPVAIDELVWELNDYWNVKAGRGLFVVNILHLPEDHDNLLIPANKQLLTIALNNIIGNAYKFSENKRVHCNLYADEKSISITIADMGIGIPADELEKVFDSFYRGANVKDYMGNGVGLYVTNKIITLFNGTITINSVAGKGTEINITFIK
jgi:signal transduction histidine kinase